MQCLAISLLLIGTSILYVPDVESASRDRNKPNWGVFFHFRQHTSLVTDWIHFDVLLPLPTLNEQPTHRVKRSETYSSFHSVGQLDARNESRQSANPVPVSLHRKGPAWTVQTSPDLEYISQVNNLAEKIHTSLQAKQKYIARLIHEVYHLIPAKHQIKTSPRDRRAPLEIVSMLAEHIFGFARQTNMDKLATRITNIMQLVQNSDTKNNAMFDSIFKIENALSLRIDNALNLMTNHTKELNSFLRSWENTWSTKYANLISLQQQEIDIRSNLDLAILNLIKLKSSINFLKLGLLTNDLISPQILETIWSTLNNKLKVQEPDQQLLFPVPSNPTELLTLSKFKFFLLNNNLVISLTIPLTMSPDRWRLFEVKIFPVTIPGHSVSTTIDLNNQYFVINNDEKQYAPVTEMALLKSSTQNSNMLEMHLTFSTIDVCLVDIFVDNTVNIKKNCQFSVIPTQKPKIIALSEHLYLFQNVPNYQLFCNIFKNKPCSEASDTCLMEYSEQRQTEQTFLFDLNQPSFSLETETAQSLNNPPFCSIVTNHTVILPKIAIYRHTAKPNFNQKYFINLAMTSEIFDKNELANINGATLFNTVPLVQIQNLELPDSNLTQKFMQNDAQLKLSLNDVIQATKNQKEVFWNDNERLWDALSQIQTNPWLYTVLGFQSLILFILISATIFLGFRVNRLGQLIVILNHQFRVAEADIKLVATRSTPSEQDNASQLNDFIVSYIPVITLTIISMYIVVKVIKALITYLSSDFTKFHTHSWIVLVIHTNQKQIYIKLQQIPSHPTQLTLMAPNNDITLKSVTGYVFPELLLLNQGEIRNTESFETFPLKNHCKVSIFQAHQLRYAIEHKYIITYAICYQNHITHMPIKNSASNHHSFKLSSPSPSRQHLQLRTRLSDSIPQPTLHTFPRDHILSTSLPPKKTPRNLSQTINQEKVYVAIHADNAEIDNQNDE